MDIPILMYHHIRSDGAKCTPYSITADRFNRQLAVLRKKGYRALSFAELFAESNRARASLKKRVIITFDDGYKSFESHAAPALLSHGFTATCFLVAGEIGGSNRWDQHEGMPALPLMDAEAIRLLLKQGMEIGAHGWKHRDLTKCDAKELDEEIVGSRTVLEKEFAQPISTFAYPYGRFDERIASAVRAAGYLGAVSIFSDAASVTADPFAMRRVYVHDGDGPLRFRAKISRPYLRLVAARRIPSG
jgi:peptidoglycan/xylan/chitin deacetylase (PgdA/CDA1 family)